jgi:quercetin dioxygenase-like cupin family protein
MRQLVVAACLLGGASLLGSEAGSDVVVVDNARVRVVRTDRAPSSADHAGAVVIPLQDGPTRKAGAAYWTGDPAPGANDDAAGPFVVVEPKTAASAAAPPSAPPSATKPGEQPSTGLSFAPLFENERVAVLRARMEKGAREGFHTHARDIVVVHLSGGAVEDTADGTTKVNHWKRGDVEFEGRGTSHSSRNAGDAIDVVLVTLKP